MQQDPDYLYKIYDEDDDKKILIDDYGNEINVSKRRLDELFADMTYYRHKIGIHISHGYHCAERAQHNNGIHY